MTGVIAPGESTLSMSVLVPCKQSLRKTVSIGKEMISAVRDPMSEQVT